MNRKIKLKQHRITVFEVALAGILLAIYSIASLLEKYVFVGAFNIGIVYAIFIIFGLALGPFKGALLGILCDTISQIIYGISTWMIEYAIVPVVIAFISGFLCRLFLLKEKRSWLFGFIFLAFISAIFITILSIYYNQIPINELAIKRKRVLSVDFVLSIGTIGLLLIWIASITMFSLYLKTKKFHTKANMALLFSILLTVFFTLIITRWLWGPFAYINYHNRFRSGTWDYKTYYPIFMIPIIFKSLLEIPFYTMIIFAIYPVILMIRNKINFYTNKIQTY
ncbi:ECF transporter S component [Mycoplasma struthionis]|uniref:ECF transporter S component n=2 Tax=Mycoplasma struthionis TaxID=538220 RepID=A0A3G8LGS3_9MOLU|nr:ECF transporter S component [Mycoplasma struthionis]